MLDANIQFAADKLRRINSIEGFECMQIYLTIDDFASHSDFSAIVLVDINVLGEHWAATLHTLFAKHSASQRFILYSDQIDSSWIIKALTLGVGACIDKPILEDSLEYVLKQFRNEGAFVSPKVARVILDYFIARKKLQANLSTKEFKIAELLYLGLTYKQIEEKTGISLDTVRFHIRNIYRKLRVNSRTQMVNVLFVTPPMGEEVA